MKIPRIIHDDAIRVAKYVKPNSIDLIYMDPPFGTGDTQTLGDYCYDDTITGENYIKFLSNRLEKLLTRLSQNGTIAVHLDYRYVNEAWHLLSKFDLNFVGDCIWSYRRWSSQKSALQSNHDSILFFTRRKVTKPNRIIIGESIVAPSGKERVGYPTQKPIGLLLKIILHASEEYRVKTILDPFMGSGTTLVAAQMLGIPSVGMDISAEAVDLAYERIHDDGYFDGMMTKYQGVAA